MGVLSVLSVRWAGLGRSLLNLCDEPGGGRGRFPGSAGARLVVRALPVPGLEQLAEREDVEAGEIELRVVDCCRELCIELVRCRSFGQERTDPTLLAQKCE